MEAIRITNNPEAVILYFIEMGDLYGAEGKEEEALEFYMRGLQHAKEIQDKARIQQFSNLIYTYL